MRVGLAPREPLDRLPGYLAEVLVRVLASSDAHQLEALGERPLVCEVVERRQQLAVREIPRRAEDHQRCGMNGKPL